MADVHLTGQLLCLKHCYSDLLSVSLREVLSGDRSNVTWHEDVRLHELNVLAVRLSSSSSSRIFLTVSLYDYMSLCSPCQMILHSGSQSLALMTCRIQQQEWLMLQAVSSSLSLQQKKLTSICLRYCWSCDKPAKAGRVLLNLSSLALFGL